MARPNLSAARRQQLLPEVARTFAELGYARTTTAELARRCGVRENILYRLWRDKQAMFIASIDYVYQLSSEIWRSLLRPGGSMLSAAERLLRYEARHHGEFGFYRIVFAGLSETRDPEIRAAVSRMYRRFHRLLCRQVETHRKRSRGRRRPDAALSAWALVGLGTVANIGREFGLLSPGARLRLLEQAGRLLLEGRDD